MAKLTGAKKKAFLERMAKGRRKAARGKPAAKKTRKTTGHRKAAKKKSNPQARTTYSVRQIKPKSEQRPGMTYELLERRSGKTLRRWAGSKAEMMATRKQLAAARKQAPGKYPKASKTTPKRKARKRNPDDLDQAERMFETFHQEAPARIVEYESMYRYPETYAEMGKLLELRFDLDSANRDFPLTKFGDCAAVTTPDGANIYFIGGDQTIDFEALGIASDKDFVELGPCTYIMYFTKKGFHDFSPTKYWHRFGEEDKILPSLVYDRLNKSLFLISGNYRVRREGIVN